MHHEKPAIIDELHAYFRQLLVDGLTPEQLELFDFFSSLPSSEISEDDYEEFPLFEGLPEMDDEDLYE